MNPTPSPIMQSPISNMSDLQQLSATQPQQTAAAPAPKGNFFTRLLPTAGGILGGIVGDVAMPFVGGIGGAAAGGALGQELENKLTGTTGSTASAAEENGLGQLAGEGIGKLASPLLGKIGDLAGAGSSKLIQGQAVKGAMDTGTANALRGYGITDLNQVGDIAPHVTTADGALNQGVLRGLSDSNQSVDLSGLNDEARNLVADNQMQLKTSSLGDISSRVERAFKSISKPQDVSTMSTRGGGTTTAYDPAALKNVDPEKAFKVAKNFETLANTARDAAYDKAGNITNPDQAAKYKIFSGLADHAKNAAFGGGDPLPLTDENRAQIIQELEPLKTINPKTYNALVDQVTNTQDLRDLRGLQAPFVNANKALTATENAVDRGGGATTTDMIKSVAPVAGSIAAGPAGGAAGLALSALGTKAADKVGANVLDRMSGVLTNPTMKTAVQKGAPVLSQLTANAPNIAANAGGTPLNAQNASNTMQTGQPNPINELIQANMAQDILDPSQYGSSAGSFLSGVMPQMQKSQEAQALVNNLLSSYGGAGGAQGLGGGLLSRLTSLIPGTAANAYQQRAAATSAQLAQILGISPQAAQGLLPQLMQNPATAGQAAGGLGSLLGAMPM